VLPKLNIGKSTGAKFPIGSGEPGTAPNAASVRSSNARTKKFKDKTRVRYKRMGLEAFQARKIAFMLGLGAKQINPAVQFLTSLYKAFLDTDASLLEINPFITTTDGRLFALDAKINFDDNALFRHADLRAADALPQHGLRAERARRRLARVKGALLDLLRDAYARRDRVAVIADGGAGRLAALVQQLPEDERHAVLSRVVQERSYGEIAQELQCSEMVIRKRVSRGLARMRQQLRGT